MNKFLEKILKRGVPFAVCLIMGASIFTACGQEKTPDEPVNPNPPIVTPIDPDKPTQPEQPDKPTQPEKPSWNREAYDNFIGLMNVEKSYKYTLTENGKTDIYEIDGEKIRYRENGDRRGVYFNTEGEKTYQYKFDESDMKYHKTNTDLLIANSIIYDSLFAGDVSNYNAETQEYTVTVDGDKYQASISSDALNLVGENKTIDITNVGDWTVSMPNNNFVVDDTEKEPDQPDKPIDPDEPIVSGDKIFTVDSLGNRVYNNKLLAETVLEALNTEVDGKTLYKHLESVGVSVDSVKYISIADGVIELGTVTTSAFGSNAFTTFKIAENILTNTDTKETVMSTLLKDKQITAKSTGVIQYSTDSEDKALAENVKIVAQNVINNLAKYGVQETLGDVKAPLSELQNAKIVSASTERVDGDGLGSGFPGHIVYMRVRATVETASGEYQFLDTMIYSQQFPSKTPFDVVLEGNEKYFMVHEMKDKKNVERGLYESKAKTQTIVAQKPELVQGKGKDF